MVLIGIACSMVASNLSAGTSAAAGVAMVSDRRIVSTCCFAVVSMCILYVSMFTVLLFLCISIDCIYSFDLRTLLTYYCVYFVTRWRLITPVC